MNSETYCVKLRLQVARAYNESEASYPRILRATYLELANYYQRKACQRGLCPVSIWNSGVEVPTPVVKNKWLHLHHFDNMGFQERLAPRRAWVNGAGVVVIAARESLMVSDLPYAQDRVTNHIPTTPLDGLIEIVSI